MNVCRINSLEYKIGHLGFPFMKLDGFWIRSQISASRVIAALASNGSKEPIEISKAAHNEAKVCTKCKEEKPMSSFYKAIANPGGKNHQCIACVRAYLKTYRERKS